MYTSGSGSGHLSRVNAVYKGFQRANIPCTFFVSAHRTKYPFLLNKGIRTCTRPEVLENKWDVFICDWRSDKYVNALPRNLAKLWVGLRRLGTIPSRFPSHFYVFGIEPGVSSQETIWPILATYPDELKSKEHFAKILGLNLSNRIALLCENGCFPKHLPPVLKATIPSGYVAVRCSNSAASVGCRDLNYYPIAELFTAADYLVIGGGYNSVHEALSYADLQFTRMIFVGGDDQRLRLASVSSWEVGRGSKSHELAVRILQLLQ
jgi:hypothetical protein